MDSSQQAELSRVIPQYLHDGRYVELLSFLAVLYLPFVPAFWKEWRNRREVKQLYKDRLSDKDKEIERLAQRIKDLENASLKTVRRK
jgi:hypothetical protein